MQPYFKSTMDWLGRGRKAVSENEEGRGSIQPCAQTAGAGASSPHQDPQDPNQPPTSLTERYLRDSQPRRYQQLRPGTKQSRGVNEFLWYLGADEGSTAPSSQIPHAERHSQHSGSGATAAWKGKGKAPALGELDFESELPGSSSTSAWAAEERTRKLDGAMDDDEANTFDSVQWTRDDEQEDVPQPSSKSKSNGKRRQQSGSQITPADPNADEVDMAGIGAGGYLECTVDSPQKENDGTKDAYVSFLVTTRSDFKTFSKSEFSVRRRFTDFAYLYKYLFRHYTHVAIPPLPDKHNMAYVRGDRFSSDFMHRRAHSLHRFIRRISLHPVLRRNSTFLMFLEAQEWYATMRGGDRDAMSDSEPMSPGRGVGGSTGSGASAFESLQDWSMNLFSKPHKPDRRFMEVKEKADKLEDDLGYVEKIVARVVRREGDLETDYNDLATQFRRLVNMEPGIGNELTSFATSVDATAQEMRHLREATDQDYLGSLRDMMSYVAGLKALLKVREQKQVDFEALTDYLNKSATDRDTLASQHGAPSLTSAPTSFLRSKLEDVRGVDHESSRRTRLRMKEMEIERLTREVEESKRTSEAFDDQVVGEVAEFERIKSVEFRETLGALADAEMSFWQGSIQTWEKFLEGMQAEGQQQQRRQRRSSQPESSS